MKNYLHNLLLKIVSSLSIITGKIHMPFTRKLMTSQDYRDMKSVMTNGMILITSTRGELTTALIPGFFSHVSMINNRENCIEAHGAGVVETDLIDFILSRDYAVLLKPKFLNQDQLDMAADYAETKVGSPYDYNFQSDNEAFYCSELAFQSYKNIDKTIPLELRNRLGNLTITPQDYWDAADKFDIMWVSKSFKDKFPNTQLSRNLEGVWIPGVVK